MGSVGAGNALPEHAGRQLSPLTSWPPVAPAPAAPENWMGASQFVFCLRGRARTFYARDAPDASPPLAVMPAACPQLLAFIIRTSLRRRRRPLSRPALPRVPSPSLSPPILLPLFRPPSLPASPFSLLPALPPSLPPHHDARKHAAVERLTALG